MREIRFALDTPEPVRLNSREYYLKGWFIPPDDPASDGRLTLLVDGIAAPVFTGLSRPDVAEDLRDPLLANCGFIARFAAPKVDPYIKLIFPQNGRDVVLAQVRFPSVPDANWNSAALNKVADYSDWLRIWEPALFWPEHEISDRLRALWHRPMISILLAVQNTEPYFLTRCIQSVLDQRYAHWQLCTVGNASDYLTNIAAQDSRIHAITGDSPPVSCNQALQIAQGEFVVLLDERDELHPFALLELARSINMNERADLIYSDEDKIDLFGCRSDPFFKANFDMDMLLSSNCIGRLAALRRTVALNIGGFRDNCGGAHEWDLLIRTVEAIGPSRVQHIPKPLYHSRIHPDPAPPLARNAATKVISDHLERTGNRAAVELGFFQGHMRLQQPRRPNIRIAVFVRVEDGPLQAAALLANADRRSTTCYELMECAVRRVGGRAPSAGPDRLTSPVRSLSEIPEDVFLFVNRPIETVNHLFFEELAAQAMREDCGLVTGISLDTSHRTVHTGFLRGSAGELIDLFSGMDFFQLDRSGQLHSVRAVEAISDEFFAVSREHLAAAGGLGSVSGSQMPRLAHRLANNAHSRGLRVRITPYAIATFEHADPTPTLDPVAPGTHSAVTLNANLTAFENMRDVLTGTTQAKATPPNTRCTQTAYHVWKYVIPLPPEELMGIVGARTIENFLIVADAWAQVVSRYTPKNASVLDIGCGCGRTARSLVTNRWITRYIGFDVVPAHIDWCRRYIAPQWQGTAEFHCFDLHSLKYNPGGAIRAKELKFPCENGGIDVVFAASLFTHLLESDAVHYLKEVRRVLSPRGFALLSIHNDVPAGQSFCGTESRVDIDPAYFIELAARAGLREHERIDDLAGQQVFILR